MQGVLQLDSPALEEYTVKTFGTLLSRANLTLNIRKFILRTGKHSQNYRGSMEINFTAFRRIILKNQPTAYPQKSPQGERPLA